MGSIVIENFEQAFLVDLHLRHIHTKLEEIAEFNSLDFSLPSLIHLRRFATKGDAPSDLLEEVNNDELSRLNRVIKKSNSLKSEAIRAKLVDIQLSADKVLKIEGIPEETLEQYSIKRLYSLKHLVSIPYGKGNSERAVKVFMETLFDDLFTVYQDTFKRN